ncbi:hypothetical protein KUTeg_015363 [Tegillarca granosa]|uniref:B30.2/SPRY domain-containing protein n=1 Tax=Tegillarca granosa TaxID=220873 RepID=A0ABQ9EPX4_TEGGR|nr:hypothetical protein KUTeg_015363 [Tegillarca granosa]
MGKTESKIESGDIPEKWMFTAKLRRKFEGDKFDRFSPGMKSVNGNTIVRTREDSDTVDGARWCRGFVSGKHVFEIAFPCNMRGKQASVGVGYKLAAIYVKKASVSVGTGSNSWGIELPSRQAQHDSQTTKKYPQKRKQKIPDRFYMYLDLDSRCLSFGTDREYFGTAFTDIGDLETPLYPMVTCSVQGATITMVYRGKGKEMPVPLRQKR